MNDSIKQLSLDFHQSSSREEVKIKKGDNKRQIRISLVDGGKPYRISEGCHAVFTCKKPDGKRVNDDCTIEGNVIVYELTDQTSAVPGLVKSEIKLYGADDKILTSPRFSIIVDDTVWDGEGENPDDNVCPGGGLIITDDGNGNVVITSTGSVSITDEGNGNVTIK